METVKRRPRRRFESAYCTISEAARLLHCDRTVVREHIQAKYLKLYRLPLQARTMLRVDEVRRLYLPVKVAGSQPETPTLQVIGGTP